MGWNDVGAGNNTSNETKYTKLTVGTTLIRARDSEPVSKWIHWIPQANGGKGVSVNCPGTGVCPVCAIRKSEKEEAEARNEKPKYSYNVKRVHAINIINRTTGEPEVLEKGKSLFEQLKNLHTEVGPIIGYDIKIVQRGVKFNEIGYTVIPQPVTPLTAEEDALPKTNLEDLAKPWTVDQVNLALAGATMEEIFPRNTQSSEDDAADDNVETA